MTDKPERFMGPGHKAAQAGAATFSAFEKFKQAHGLGGLSFPVGLTNDNVDSVKWPELHGGKGVIDVKCAFRDERVAEPALLLTYSIPPGASEGVHTHSRDDEVEGSYDEFYYIISGSGEMQIAEKRIAVKDGDHIFVPNDVAHGIENTSENTILKVYLVAMMRE